MKRPKRSRSSKEYVQDVEETAKFDILAGARKRKRRKFTDYVDGKKSKSKNESQIPEMMNPRNGGDTGNGYLQNLEEEKPAKRSSQRQTVSFLIAFQQ